MGMEKYQNLSYENLRDRIRLLKVQSYQEYQDLLKESWLKNFLINSPRKYDFIWLVQYEEDETILRLLDEEGISYLQGTTDLVDKMNGLLTCGKPFVNQLLTIPSFCDLVLKYANELSSYFHSIEPEGAISLIQYAQEKNIPEEDLKMVLYHFSEKTMCEVVKKVSLSLPLVKETIRRGSKEAIDYLLEKDSRITTLLEYPFSTIYSLAQKGVQIPPHLLEEPDFQKELVNLQSIKEYRFLIEALRKNNDVSILEAKRKKYYDALIDSYDEKENMVAIHRTFYEKIAASLSQGEGMGTLIDSLPELFNPFGTGLLDENARMELGDLYHQKDIPGIHRFFERESNLLLTNAIVDYHFEDLPYNFFLDLKQLCHFQETEGRTLSEEEISLYQRILDLDSLSYAEKKALHQQLSQTDFISKYYDDFKAAKEKSYQLIKEKMLTDKTALQFKDEELSKKAGVDIYVLDGEPFYALVKSLGIPKQEPMERKNIFYSVDGGSYSLDGSEKLNTFQNPQLYYNVAYRDFPIDQVLHTYPVDSFSKFVRGYVDEATNRVYQLMTPEELVKRSYQYNEIVMMQQNRTRKNDEFNDRLQIPQMFAIYCYDKITDNDILSAKNLGLSIILVKTMSYRAKMQATEEKRMNMHDTTGLSNGYQQGINYIDSIQEDDMYGRRK